MSRFVILLAVIGIAMVMWFKIKNAKGEERKKLIIWTAASAAIAGLGLLAVTGHLNIITAAIAGLIALAPKLINVLRYLPLLNRFRQQTTNHQQSNTQQANSTTGAMNKPQACKVLGIKEGATREEIITAHKRMMQKVHPDRGGSDFLAAQINQAKDTLLS